MALQGAPINRQELFQLIWDHGVDRNGIVQYNLGMIAGDLNIEPATLRRIFAEWQTESRVIKYKFTFQLKNPAGMNWDGMVGLDAPQSYRELVSKGLLDTSRPVR